MTTEFPIEWEGFTAHELQRLKTRWSRLQFSPEFTRHFRGSISKGSPGEPGVFMFEANDLTFFGEHYSGHIGFEDLDELVDSTAQLATKFYKGLVAQKILRAE